MSIPPGSGGRPHGPGPHNSPRAVKQRWPRRHPVWSALITLAVLLIIIIAATSKPAKTSNTATDTVPGSTATPAASSSTLECHAQTSSKQPRDHTTVTVSVHTAAHAAVTATTHDAPLKNKKITGSSNAGGNWAMRLRIGDTAPGTRIVVTVRVSSHGGTASCQASFRPRAAISLPAASATQPAVSPPPAPTATQPAAPPTTAASCYPLSDEGTCYEPGEYCRDDNHGESGVAGNGENIVCEDNDGWRWEPA